MDDLELNKAVKGTEGYDMWLEHFRAKRKKKVNGTDTKESKQEYDVDLGKSLAAEKGAREAAGPICSKLSDVVGSNFGFFIKEPKRPADYTQQSKSYIDFIKQEGTYKYEDIQSFFEEFAAGAEATCFKEDNFNVLKVVDTTVYTKAISDFIDNRIYYHNLLFPETAYELVGFTIKHGAPHVILRQPLVVAGLSKDSEKFFKYMEDRGFKKTDKGFENDFFILQDLHEGNVLEDEEGRYFFVDPLIVPKS